jgi:hypothetical protein
VFIEEFCVFSLENQIQYLISRLLEKIPQSSPFIFSQAPPFNTENLINSEALASSGLGEHRADR